MIKRIQQGLAQLRQPEGVLAVIFSVACLAGPLYGGIFGALGIGGALLLALTIGLKTKQFPMSDPKASLAAVCFLLLAWASVLWAQEASLVRQIAGRMTTIIVPLLFLTSPAVWGYGRKGAGGMEIAFAVLISIGLIFVDVSLIKLLLKETAEGGETSEKLYALAKFNRGFSYIIILALPLIAVLVQGWRKDKTRAAALIVLLASLALALVLTRSRATQLGAVIGAGAFVVALRFPRVVAWALGALVVASVAWPWAAAYGYAHHLDKVLTLPNSWLARMEIWDYVSYRIGEQPWLGWGIGNAKMLNFASPHGELYLYTSGPASHAHNIMMQLWVELGPLGILLGVGTLLAILRLVGKLDFRYQSYGYAAYALGLTLLLVAYTPWTDSLWGAFALIMLAFARLPRPGQN